MYQRWADMSCPNAFSGHGMKYLLMDQGIVLAGLTLSTDKHEHPAPCETPPRERKFVFMRVCLTTASGANNTILQQRYHNQEAVNPSLGTRPHTRTSVANMLFSLTTSRKRL